MSRSNPASFVKSTGSLSTDNETNHFSSSEGLSPTTDTKRFPAFLEQPASALQDNFNHLQALTKARIANSESWPLHPIAHARNRYTKISPWADNYIQLKYLHYPYNNASPITLSTTTADSAKSERFIATQGPINAAHFWLLVWQEKVKIVVMLTQVEEKGVEKCLQYYPKDVGPRLHLPLSKGPSSDPGYQPRESPGEEMIVFVRSIHVEHCSEVREIVIRRGEEIRKVYHFLFLGWPDYGIPQTQAEEDALLGLIKMTKFRMYLSDEERSRPRLVHCSAGCGRTGTFIALDHLLRELELDRKGIFGKWRGNTNKTSMEGGEEIQEDPIYDTVLKLREQRMWMVYTFDQFQFIYRVLRKKW